jgi:uncharacterized membrane protein YidH (DUF202 family)
VDENPFDYFAGPGVENQKKGLPMNKAISLAILAGGILLLIFGINAYDSSSSDISRFFTGSATDKSIWMLVGGVVVTVLGLVGLLRGSKTA